MKYALVYSERANGYNWSVRNSEGLYAAWVCSTTNKVHLRGWKTAGQAADYMEKHLTDKCVWAPWFDEKPLPLKPVPTAAGYKPVHGGYPDAAAGWTNKGTDTGRFKSSTPHITEQDRPMVWPFIPQHDDGSNEEASTVPSAVVEALIAEEEKQLYQYLRSQAAKYNFIVVF